MKKNVKKSLTVKGVVTFRIEDEAVLESLLKAENASLLINEAIRDHGDDALLNVLRRDAETAQAKFRDAQESVEKKRRRHVSPKS